MLAALHAARLQQQAAEARLRQLQEDIGDWKEEQRRKYARDANKLFKQESARLEKQYEDSAVAMRLKLDVSQAVRGDRAEALAAAQARTDLHETKEALRHGEEERAKLQEVEAEMRSERDALHGQLQEVSAQLDSLVASQGVSASLKGTVMQ